MNPGTFTGRWFALLSPCVAHHAAIPLNSVVSVSQVVFARKLLLVIVSIWFPPSTSMTTRSVSFAAIVFVSTVLSCDCCPSLFYPCCPVTTATIDHL